MTKRSPAATAGGRAVSPRNGYASRLHLDELLELQATEGGHHDELLFVVVHQAYELWFKLLLGELEAVRELMSIGDVRATRHLLARVHAIVRVMNEQVSLVDTMSFRDFLAFRSSLGSASALESVQFREVEFLSGLKDPRYVCFDDREPNRLEERLRQPSLWDAYCVLVERCGLAMPVNDPARRRASLSAIFADADGYADLFAVSEDLVAYDEGFRVWRCRHALMVERQIGARRGTGGTSGVRYLQTTLDKRFYPELWDARSVP